MDLQEVDLATLDCITTSISNTPEGTGSQTPVTRQRTNSTRTLTDLIPSLLTAALGGSLSPVTSDLESGRRGTIGVGKRVATVVSEIVRSSRTNVLLLFVPVGLILHACGVNPIVCFATNILGMIPLVGVPLSTPLANKVTLPWDGTALHFHRSCISLFTRKH